jgi:predicted TIM-barrel fold metal-dependent hydrolase
MNSQVCCIQDTSKYLEGQSFVDGGNAASKDPKVRVKARQIVDAHHHVWDTRLKSYPWLCDEPPIKFRYGDYSSIRRPYLPSDYLADALPYEIVASVYVEAEWNRDDPLGEMDYIAGLREAEGLPTVAVAQAWLDRKDCAAVLESHAARSFVRSIRHKPRANEKAGEANKGAMTDPSWRAGYALLGALNLRFDLQTPWWHLAEARALADDFPSTQIILNHTGLPADRSADGIAGWRSAMAKLAGATNVAVKISGLGQPGIPWTAQTNREIVLTTIELFGVERCMFASNFPVDSVCASFTDIFNGFEQIVADFGEAEQDALFAGNARRIYAIGGSDG